MKYILICDESGQKSYADKDPAEDYPLGVAAGLCIPEAQTEVLRDANRRLINDFGLSEIDGKIHITDTEDQSQLRQAAFNVISEYEIPWLYAAIAQTGFHDEHQRKLDSKQRAESLRRSTVRIEGNDRVEWMHPILLSDVIVQSAAYLLDHRPEASSLEVIIDQIDKAVLKGIEDGLNKLWNFGQPTVKEVKGWDTVKKERRSGTIRSEITEGLEQLDIPGLDCLRPEVKISSEATDTLIVDILANSIHYHLREKLKRNPGMPLVSLGAIAGHPVAGLCVGLGDGSGPWHTDVIYRNDPS